MSRLKELGKNIAEYRKKKDWSQEFLAEKVDLSREYIGRVENGQKSISLRKLFLIADVLGTPVKNFFNFN
jgi:transcriptional regulator with XRE-family HTH domain